MSSMLLRMVVLMALVLGALPTAGAMDGDKQPVFLMSPHKEKYSAWSLYLVVDKGDPGKVLQLGLEKLKKKNSKDMTYEEVLAAQRDPKTEREVLGTLDAANFSSGRIEVEKDDALHVSLTPQGSDYQLMVSIRISADKRFTIGGKDQGKHNVILRYNKDSKSWSATAKTLTDTEGKRVTDKPISGIVFPVTGTGIYRIIGVIEGEPVLLLDR